MKVANKKDVLLLMLYSPGSEGSFNERICGRTRLVKMLFLFRKEVLPAMRSLGDITPENFYDFFGWNFGPFSTQIYDDLTFFQLRGFIESLASTESASTEASAEWDKWVDVSGADMEGTDARMYQEECFSLTDKGQEWTKNVYDSLSTKERKIFQDFKSRLSKAPLQAILQYVYTTYPEMTDSSLIKEQVLSG
ncbi:MAG: hypothetical protein QOJ65_1463 [Fimbriimonadaceae bacterium]|nr:hypothetical protein [Fimbriimonadaceae bacterium]